MLKKQWLLIVVLAFSAILVACSTATEVVEEAGDAVAEVAEEAVDAVEDAGEAVADVAEEAVETVEEVVSGDADEEMAEVEVADDSMAADPSRELNIIAVQHAECAWDSFWCTVQDGINQGAADNGVNVQILAPDSFDVDATAALIEQAVAAQPDGIMLTVTDAVVMEGAINSALAAGIPVVAYNAGAGPIADGIDYLTYFGQDEYAGGY